MFRKSLLVLAVATSASCIFGGGKEKNSTDNNESNITNNESDAANNRNNVTDMGTDMMSPVDMAMPPDDMDVPPDMTGPDMQGPPQTYLTLDARDIGCQQPRTAWFAPSATGAHPPITANSHVTTGGAPRDQQATGAYLGATASVAYATKQGGNIGVYAAVVRAADGDTQFLELTGDSFGFDSTADVYGVTLTPVAVNRTMDMPVADVLKVLVATSEGVEECTLTVDMNDVANMTCEASPWNDTVRDLQIDQPSRVDPAPIFLRVGANDNRYALNLLGFDTLAAVSGPPTSGTGEVIGLLKSDLEGNVSPVDILGVDTVLADGIFGERLAFGVTSNSFGAPVLLMLHADPMLGLQPIALRSDDLNVSAYSRLTLDEWRLSRRLEPRRGTFTFIDEYDITPTLWGSVIPPGFGISFQHGSASASFGYVGITGDATTAGGDALVFSQPGGFGGQDFIEFALPDSQEVVAFKNVPSSFKPAATNRAPLAVIHGEERDALAIFDWGFSTRADYVEDLLEPGFTNAQRMVPNWWVDDAGTISMLAQRTGGAGNTRWVIAAVAADISDLAGACGP